MNGVRKRAWLVAASVRSGSGAIPDAAVLGRRPRARVVQGIGGADIQVWVGSLT
jgi:hypothetical protein